MGVTRSPAARNPSGTDERPELVNGSKMFAFTALVRNVSSTPNMTSANGLSTVKIA